MPDPTAADAAEVFDELTALAAELCEVPMALISLQDANRQWFTSRRGLQIWETSLEDSFGAHASDPTELMIVPDALADARFAASQAVAGDPWIRFYAGAPLVTTDGYRVGSLCVLDVRPRTLTAVQCRHLTVLSHQVMAHLSLRRQAGELAAEVAALHEVFPAVSADQFRRNDSATDAFLESESRWRQLFSASPVGIGLANEDGLFVAANPALCALFGRPESAVIGRSSVEYTHPDDLDSNNRATALIESSPDGVARIETRYIRPDGQIRWAWLTVTHTPGPQGQTWTLAHVQDVTDRLAVEQVVRDSQANLSAVAAVIKKIQTGGDARQTIVDAGLALAQASYVSWLEPSAEGRSLLVSAATEPRVVGTRIPLELIAKIAPGLLAGDALFLPEPAGHVLVSPAFLGLVGARAAYLVPVRSADLVTAVLVVGWSHQVPSLEDRRAGVVTLLADQAGVALRQVALVAELETQALTDPLTSLPNRRNWEKTLTRLLDAAAGSGLPLTVALIDLDHFKAFNDTRGHAAGDILLFEFAHEAHQVVRAGDTLARWGGEEFAVALPNCQLGEAASVLERVRMAMPQDQTCSIGYATWDAIETAEQLMVRVDDALYAAKSGGRDQIRGASADVGLRRR